MANDKLTEKEKFELANDIDFSLAIFDAEEGRSALAKYSFNTIGDRIRLINELEKRNFKIVKV